LNPNEEFCLSLTTLNEREEPQLNVYPNPLLDFLQILNHTSASSIRIFDISGKLIKTYDLFPGSNLFDLSSLSHGLYFLSTNDGAVNHRIIKIR
jgi:hypothetical protein